MTGHRESIEALRIGLSTTAVPSVAVRDTGPGKAPAVLTQRFTPFFMTKPAGLGVALPASQAEGGSVPPGSATHRAGRRGRVLVVDDDPMIGKVIRRTLAAEHHVVVATSAKDAWDQLMGGSSFDVILCDLMMPVVTGLAFYRQLMIERPEQAGRLVFLTGGAFTATARHFLDEVPNACMEKPFSTQKLRSLVNARIQ